MARDFSNSFYKSKAWQACRRSYIAERIAIDGGLCEVCRENEGYIVHHKIILNARNIHNPQITLNHDNLQYVCKSCHDLFEGHGVVKCRKGFCIFGADGQPIPKDSPR